MDHKINRIILPLLLLLNMSCSANSITKIKVGAEQTERYFPMIKAKRIALMVNQTSLSDTTHLVDLLANAKMDIKKIFAVEHGFRGKAANGIEFNDTVDTKTGLPIISLYGKKKKPSTADLSDVDVVIFDIQDVGCRFYTYGSSLFYLMEACAENNIQMIVLDRPNPNGDYVDGPVLDLNLESFVGLLPIPIVHGCTVGELALMINGEKWLANQLSCTLEVITVENYDHSMLYDLPVQPSPNLPNNRAVRLYPSLCFFEATNVSIGRGTEFPFQLIGYPGCSLNEIEFKPQTIEGISSHPIFEGERCTGVDLRSQDTVPQFTLSYFIEFAQQFEDKNQFWKSKRWIELLSGTTEFYEQINRGESDETIRATWKEGLKKYIDLRQNYLLYPDFIPDASH
ncbi:MAG: exo-beta-N-acetylmuramidase NamZ domain-containing protein [Prolixibacteraceae bacterium]